MKLLEIVKQAFDNLNFAKEGRIQFDEFVNALTVECHRIMNSFGVQKISLSEVHYMLTMDIREFSGAEFSTVEKIIGLAGVAVLTKLMLGTPPPPLPPSDDKCALN